MSLRLRLNSFNGVNSFKLSSVSFQILSALKRNVLRPDVVLYNGMFNELDFLLEQLCTAVPSIGSTNLISDIKSIHMLI